MKELVILLFMLCFIVVCINNNAVSFQMSENKESIWHFTSFPMMFVNEFRSSYLIVEKTHSMITQQSLMLITHGRAVVIE